jgi:hypothetical protein
MAEKLTEQTEVVDNGFDITFKTKFPDIDLYPLAGMYLPESKERKVDISLIKQHIKKATTDTNSLALIMGPLGVIPNIYRHFTIEDALKGRNEIAQMMQNIEKLNEEYEKFTALDSGDKQDDYYLKATEQFKMFTTIKHTGNENLLQVKLNEEGKVNMLSAEFNKKAKAIQNLLFEEYLKEIVEQYYKLTKPLADKGKIIGFIPSNEENKTHNIGAFDIMEALAEKLEMKDKYVPYKNLVKIQAGFKSYLTENTEQLANVYVSALPTNSLDAAENFIRTVSENNPSFDTFILSGSIGTAIINEERWFRDEKLGVTISKQQTFILVPTYAEVIEPNPARKRRNLTTAQTHEFKIKLSVIKEPKYIDHPELLDEKGNIIDINDPKYLATLKPVTLTKEEVKYLKSVGKIYKSPYNVVADLIEIGATQSSSKLIKASHVTNAPKSSETLAKMVNAQRTIDKLPDLFTKLAVKNGATLSEAIEGFDHTDPNEVYKVMQAANERSMSKSLNGGK